MAPAQVTRADAVVELADAPALCVCPSPDGVHVASGHADNVVRVWEAASGRLLRAFEGHQGPVSGVVLVGDGLHLLLASASNDKTVRLWDAASGQLRGTLRGHKKGVERVAFSPDGLTIASASEDRTVRLWESATGNLRCVLEGHMSQVWSVAFSPDGLTVASASEDGTVRLWSTATGAHRATLVSRSSGWAAIRADGRYRMGGDIAGAFWHVVGLARFEPGELDVDLPEPLRIADDEPLLPLK